MGSNPIKVGLSHPNWMAQAIQAQEAMFMPRMIEPRVIPRELSALNNEKLRQAIRDVAMQFPAPAFRGGTFIPREWPRWRMADDIMHMRPGAFEPREVMANPPPPFEDPAARAERMYHLTRYEGKRMTVYLHDDETLSRVVSESMTHTEAINTIQSANGRRLGSGQGTTAYSVTTGLMPKPGFRDWQAHDNMAYRPAMSRNMRPEARCYRVTRPGDKGAMLTAEEAIRTDDPLAPKVYAVIPLKGGAWASEMEVLDPMRCEREDLHSCLERLLPGCFRKQGIYHVQPNVDLFHKSEFARAIEHRRAKNGASYDLHRGNFMMRGQQLVLLDPLYG